MKKTIVIDKSSANLLTAYGLRAMILEMSPTADVRIAEPDDNTIPRDITFCFAGKHTQCNCVIDTRCAENELRAVIAKALGVREDSTPIVQSCAKPILTNRETDVLKLIIKGLMNKEIADSLNIGIETVISHRKKITSKLGIKTVSGLTMYAMMNGIK